MRPSLRFRALAATIVVALCAALVPAIGFAPPAEAAVSNRCDGAAANDQNNLRVTPMHGSVFYIDSSAGQNVDAAYVGYQVTNRAATTASDLWVRVDNFTGGVVQLRSANDANQPLGAIAASASNTAFFMVKAVSTSTSAQSHLVHVYRGQPGAAGSTELYSCVFSFARVQETIKANSNKVTSIPAVSVGSVGTTVTVTVDGNTGLLGQGNSIDGRSMWLSPASRSTWPTEALRLESTTLQLYDNVNRRDADKVGGPYLNQLKVTPPTTSNRYYYRATYTFRIIGAAPSSTLIKPLAQISSGTQMKHADVSDAGIGATTTIDVTAPPLQLAVTKTAGSTATIASGTITFGYTITLTNSGATAVSVDTVTDTPAPSLAYVAGSARFAGAAMLEPSRSASDATKLVFSGPFSLPAGGSRTLTYSMSTACAEGSFSYKNSATAAIGTLSVGSTSTTLSGVTLSGSCGSTTVVVIDDPKPLPIAVTTGAASSVTGTSATFNGTIDPQGQSGQAITWTYGTSSTLAGATTASGGTTTSSTTPYSVSLPITGLSPGVRYYAEVSVGAVKGGIVDFVTPEPVANPTATTLAATNIALVAASGRYSATLNGSIDPNQVSGGAKYAFQYALDSSSGACTSLGAVTTGPIAQDTDVTPVADIILNGSFATAVDQDFTDVFTSNTWYCTKVVAYYGSGYGTSVVASNWVAFKALVRSAQTITFATPADVTMGSTRNSGATTSASGLTIQYSSNTTDTCTVSATGVITPVSAGLCSITASQSGNELYEPAVPVTVTITVTKQSQTITFPTPADLTVTDTLSAGASTSAAGLSVSYTSDAPTICTVSASGTITAIAAGTCTVTASQSGNGTYSAAANVSKSLTVTKRAQSITFPVPTISIGSTTSAAATASSNLSVTYSSTTTDICTVTAGGSISGIKAGDCTIKANQSGDSTWAAALEVSRTVAVKDAQNVTVDSVSPVAVGAAPKVTGRSSAGFDLTWSSKTTSICTVAADGTVTTLARGTCTIEGAHPGNSYYNAASNSTSFAVKSNQTITATAPGTTAKGATATVEASTDATGLSVEYSSDSTDICTVASTGVVTAVSAGLCSITVKQPGASFFFAATPKTVTFRIKQPQSIRFEPAASVGIDSTLTVDATADSTETVTFSSLTPTICSVTGSIVTPIKRGDCKVKADQSGNDTYFAATAAEATIRVKDKQTITATAPGTTAKGSTATVEASTDASGLSVEYSSDTTSVCTVSASGVVTGVTAGLCSITVKQPGADYYLAATPKTVTFRIKQPQSIRFLPDADLGLDSTATLAATTDATGAVSYSSATPEICSVTGGVVTPLKRGECTLKADHAGDDTYFAATTVERTVHVKANQSITFAAPSSMITSGEQQASASADSELPIEWESATGTICSVDSHGLITALAVGDCTIVAKQPGTEAAFYFPATSTSRTFRVTQGPPVVATDSLATGRIGSEYSVSLKASGGNGGYKNWTLAAGSLPAGLTWNPEDGTITGTPEVATTELIELSFTVDDSENLKSPTKKLKLQVLKKTQTVSADPVRKTYGDPEFALDVTTSVHGRSPKFTAKSTGAAHLSTDGVVQIKAAGTTTFTVGADGDDTYYAAPAVTIDVTIDKKTLSVKGRTVTVTYGESTPDEVAEPVLGAFVYEDTVDDITAPSCSSSYGAPTARGVGDYSVTCDGGDADNYEFEFATGTIEVTKATLAVKPTGAKVTYGDTVAKPTDAEISGFKYTDDTDDITAPTCTTDYADEAAAGTYAVTCEGGAADNYDFDIDEGTITVEKADLDVEVKPKEVTYGDDLATPVELEFDGFKYTDDESDIELPDCSTEYEGGAGVGTYPIDCEGGSADNYDVTVVENEIEVLPADLEVAAKPQEVTYGDDLDDPIEFEFDGFKYTDDESDIELPDCSTEYEGGAGVGTYPIDCEGGSADNYDVTVVENEIEVLPADLEVAAKPQEVTYGDDLDDPIEFEFDGFKYTDDENDIELPDCSTEYESGADVGTYAIECTGGSADNYDVTVVGASITVTRAPQSITLYPDAPANMRPGAQQSFTATVSSGATPTVTASGACSWSGGTITATRAGTCTISVSAAQSTNYFAATTQTRTLQVTSDAPVSRTITVTVATAPFVAGGTAEARATVSPSVGRPTWSAGPSTVCRISSDGTITLIAQGTCTVVASLAEQTVTSDDGDTDYSAATGTRSFEVAPLIGPSPSPTPGPRPPLVSPTPVTPQGTLPEPRTPVVAPRTIDIGAGTQEMAPNIDWTKAVVRNAPTLATEVLGGFRANSTAGVQVVGARTVAQLVITPTALGRRQLVEAALKESESRRGMDEMSLMSATFVTEADPRLVLGGTPSRSAVELFSAAGLGIPQTVGRVIGPESSDWLHVSAQAGSLRPGTVVYLAVTSSPVIIAAAEVGDDGTASLTGEFPLSILDGGLHSLRIVGVHRIETASVDHNGDLVLDRELMDAITVFDGGTYVAVLVNGENPQQGEHLVVRKVLIDANEPWWVAWMLGLGLIANLGMLWLRNRTGSRKRAVAAISGLAVGLVGLYIVWASLSYAMLPWIAALVGATQLVAWWPTKRQRTTSDPTTTVSTGATTSAGSMSPTAI